jgi:hypothetical protein
MTTPLFAAAAALQPPSHLFVESNQPSWLTVGTTFAPHLLPQFATRPLSPDSVDTLSDEQSSDGASDTDAAIPRAHAPPFETGGPSTTATATAQDVAHTSKDAAMKPLFVTDRRGDTEQGRFGRMYSGDAPSYFAPSLKSRPLGLSQLTRSRRGHPTRLVAIHEGIGSGIVRPALSVRQAAAVRATGGAWAQVGYGHVG